MTREITGHLRKAGIASSFGKSPVLYRLSEHAERDALDYLNALQLAATIYRIRAER
jgi:hypothetical protein